MALFGKLLAEDVEKHDGQAPAEWHEAAHHVLSSLDHLDDGDDPVVTLDAGRAMSTGELWLAVAESGAINEETVAHVLNAYSPQLGFSGPPWVRHLLAAIDSADDDNRMVLMLACPEYVGLWQAICHVPGAANRLLAVVGG